jgi:peptidyl-prolyl cis-trans isomerase SurA
MGLLIKLKRLIAASLIAAASASFALAAEQRILATVNDKPITTLDVDQRLRLGKVLLGESAGISRAQVLDDLINEIVKIEAARNARLEVTPLEIDSRIKEISKSMKLDAIGFEKRMRQEGIGQTVIRRYFGAQMAFGRLLRFKYRDEVKVDEQDVDRKMADIKAQMDGQLRKVMKDPRMKTLNVYSLQEIEFPVENPKDPASATLMQARAVEANQFVSRFKGCKSAKAAASGIFNVRVGRLLEADADRLPKPLRKMLDSKGPGFAYGPMRSPGGVQVIGFCGKRTVKPQVPQVKYPTRDQVKQAALNDKYRSVEKKYVAQMRKSAVIEFKAQGAGEN